MRVSQLLPSVRVEVEKPFEEKLARARQLWRFIEENSIPVNPAYKKYGLKRVGCQPCTAHKGWREELLRTNPRMYKFIMERYFGQKLLLES